VWSDAEKADFRIEVLGITSDFEECFCPRAEQKIVDDLLGMDFILESARIASGFFKDTPKFANGTITTPG
jgi:hypothetical protein